MSEAMTTTNASGGALAGLQTLKAGLANVRATVPAAGGTPFLRMLKDGTWVYGADDVEPEEGQRFAVNPLSIEHGYICWKTREEDSKEPAKKLGERMQPMTAPLPNEADLPHMEEGKWTYQIGIGLKGVDGADNGVEVEYKTNSVGGTQAASALIDAILTRVTAGEADVCPIVELANSTYKHKQYGKIYTPEFKIVGWFPLNGMPGDAGPAEEQVENPSVGEMQDEAGAEKEATAAAAEAPTEGRVRRRR